MSNIIDQIDEILSEITDMASHDFMTLRLRIVALLTLCATTIMEDKETIAKLVEREGDRLL